MFGKRNTSQFKSQIEATVLISVDHNTKLTEDQILDEFDKNVSELIKFFTSFFDIEIV